MLSTFSPNFLNTDMACLDPQAMSFVLISTMRFLNFNKAFFTGLLVLFLTGTTAAFCQQIHIYTADSQSIEQAMVSYQTIGSAKSHVVFSDPKGMVNFSTLNAHLPLHIQISATGMKILDDTITTQNAKNYFLKANTTQLKDIVITGQYAPGSIDHSVHVVKVINREKIEQMAAQNLTEALKQSMNIRLSQDNILGSSMSLQGLSGQSVKILIDGVPVIGRQNGNIDLSQINMNNVERIEIVEGPLSVNYGTDAIAGTINIITKKDQESTYNAQANAYYESNGTYNISGKAGYQKNKNTLQLTLGRDYFDGWHQGEKPFTYVHEIKSDSSRFVSWKPKEQIFGGILYSHQIKDLNFRASADIFDEDITNRGLPRAPYGESAMDDRYHTFRNSNTLNLTGKISRRYHANFTLGYNYYRRIKNTFYKDLTTLEQQPTGGQGDQDTTAFQAITFRGNIASTKTKRLNYEVGYDLSYENNKSEQIIGKEQHIGDYALFSTAEYSPISNLVLKPGLRLAYNTKFDAPLIPSLNLKYDLPLSEDNNDYQKMIFRASYARGFRAPSLKELYFDFVDINHDLHGNQDLKAEYSDNFIFNVVYSTVSSRSAFKLEWNNFYNKIHNLIVLAQTSGSAATYTYANIGYTQTFGSNLTAEYSYHNFRASASGGLIGLYNELHDEAPETDEFSYSPEVSASISYDWHKTGMSFSFFYKYTGNTPAYALDADDNVRLNTLGDYQMADVSISKSFWQRRLTLTAGSKNLFNVTNITGSSDIGSPHGGAAISTPLSMGRTYFLAAAVNLNY